MSSTVAGVTSFRHEDALGSLRFLTDGGQNVLGSSVFEAFGAAVSATGPTARARFGWVGGADCQTEPDTGLVLMGHRYYDSRLGRFISQDPAKAGTNWYNYCGNDPVNNLDPLGLLAQPFSESGDPSLEQLIQDTRAHGGLDGESYVFGSGSKARYFTIPGDFTFTHVIPGFNVTANFMQAKRFANTPTFHRQGTGNASGYMALPNKAEKIAYLIGATRPGSHGDPKHVLEGLGGNSLYPSYDRVGQYGYGAIVAGLGLDLDTGLEGAGIAQTVVTMFSFNGNYSSNIQQNGIIGLGAPYGDDPASQLLIGQGFNAYKNR